jgi:hypothetical protein
VFLGSVVCAETVTGGALARFVRDVLDASGKLQKTEFDDVFQGQPKKSG